MSTFRKYRAIPINRLPGEWVYGSLIQRSARWGFRYYILVNSDDEESEDFEVEVDFKTVGQFIGLKDKNGGEIYEGDIIQPSENCGMAFEVGWTDASNTCCNNPSVIGFDTCESIEKAEIRGNIYDHGHALINQLNQERKNIKK